MPEMCELVYMLLVFHFFVDLDISIILIRREYWCLLLYMVLFVVNIQVIMRIESTLLLSEPDCYVKTLLIVDILFRF